MNITYLERQELNALSKEVFGKSSWWQTHLVKRGVKKLADDIAKNPQGSHYRYFFSIEEIKEYILRIQANSKELLEKMKLDAETKTNVSSK